MTSAAEQGQSGPKSKPSPGDSQATSMPAEAREQGRAHAQEFGGPSGPEPTRYGDWERAGRCVDF